MSLRETILGARPKLEQVEVPEWGCSVFLRRWTVGERESLLAWHAAAEKAEDASLTAQLHARVCLLSLADEKGARLFTDDDLEKVKGLDATVVTTLGDKALDLNGMKKREAGESEADKSAAG